MNLETIEKELKTGQVAPQRLAKFKDWLAGESSSLMDRQLALQMNFATWFKFNREKHKSDKSARLEWQTLESGIEEMKLETVQRKIKVLREAISSHIRVASDQARNLY